MNRCILERSLADNFPNVLLEASAAGLPSVVFDVGGCSEVVRNNINGLVARQNSAVDLARCIMEILSMNEASSLAMRENCRKIAVSEYALNIQADRCADIFRQRQSQR
jgi:glycosyltransferase involved in cell wall biosynthesis